MGIIDSFDKKMKQKEADIKPPKGHTVSEILKDEKNSVLFGKLLEENGEKDLVGRITTGDLEPDDIALLSNYRIKFSEKIESSKKIENLLTKENIDGITHASPEFANVIDVVTPTQAIKIIQNYLRELCFADETKFNEIAETIETYDNYRNEKHKENNDTIEKLCEDIGISQADYENAIAIEDPDEKKEVLKKLVKGENGKLQNSLNRIFGIDRRKLRKLENSEILLRESIDELNTHRKNIGSMLALSISNDDDAREALSRELRPENAPKEQEDIPFADFKGTKINEEEFEQNWKDVKGAKNYDTLSVAEQDLIKDDFIKEQQEKYRERNTKRKGFWATIFATMVEEKINERKSALS